MRSLEGAPPSPGLECRACGTPLPCTCFPNLHRRSRALTFSCVPPLALIFFFFHSGPHDSGLPLMSFSPPSSIATKRAPSRRAAFKAICILLATQSQTGQHFSCSMPQALYPQNRTGRPDDHRGPLSPEYSDSEASCSDRMRSAVLVSVQYRHTSFCCTSPMLLFSCQDSPPAPAPASKKRFTCFIAILALL